MRARSLTLVLPLVLPLLPVSSPTSAQAVHEPAPLQLSGVLTDPDGTLLGGSYLMRFCLFGQEAGGEALICDEASVAVTDGRFSHSFGTAEAFAAMGDQDVFFLDVTVEGEELAPRHPITDRAIGLDLPLPEEPTPVDCDAGQSIGAALQEGRRNLLIYGTCREDVLVMTDDVALAGAGDARIIGQQESAPAVVTALGARRLRLQDLVIEGEGVGIGILDNASAMIHDVVVKDFKRSGIEFLGGATGRIGDVKVINAGKHGIEVAYGSSVTFAAVEVTGSEANGLTVAEASFALIDPFIFDRGETLAGPRFEVEPQAIAGGPARLAQFAGAVARFSGNGRYGLRVQNGSAVFLCAGDIADNGHAGISAADHATVALCGGNRIDGGGGPAAVAENATFRQSGSEGRDHLSGEGDGDTPVIRLIHGAMTLEDIEIAPRGDVAIEARHGAFGTLLDLDRIELNGGYVVCDPQSTVRVVHGDGRETAGCGLNIPGATQTDPGQSRGQGAAGQSGQQDQGTPSPGGGIWRALR